MDWQSLMVARGAHPARSASGELSRQQLAQSLLTKMRAHRRLGQTRAGAADLHAHSPMHRNLEKVISTTLASWAAQDEAGRSATRRPR